MGEVIEKIRASLAAYHPREGPPAGRRPAAVLLPLYESRHDLPGAHRPLLLPRSEDRGMMDGQPDAYGPPCSCRSVRGSRLQALTLTLSHLWERELLWQIAQ